MFKCWRYDKKCVQDSSFLGSIGPGILAQLQSWLFGGGIYTNHDSKTSFNFFLCRIMYMFKYDVYLWYECSMKLRNVKYDARYQREYLEQYACNDKPEMNTGFFYQVIVIFSLFTGRRFWLSTPTDLWTSPQHNSVILGNFCKSRTQL